MKAMIRRKSENIFISGKILNTSYLPMSILVSSSKGIEKFIKFTFCSDQAEPSYILPTVVSVMNMSPLTKIRCDLLCF